MSNLTRTWWAANTASARRTAVGTAALGIALTLVSYVVWMSPTNPVAQTIQSVSQDAQRADSLAKERTELLVLVRSLKSELRGSSGDVDELEAQLAALESALSNAESELTDTKSELEETATQLAAAKNENASLSAPSTVTASLTRAPIITAPSKATLLNPKKQLFGMYTSQAPFNWATFDDTASKLNVTPDVVGYFGGWDEPFRANAVTRSWSRGFLPMLTWESRPIKAQNDEIEAPEYSLPLILGSPSAGVPGAFDAYLHKYAKDIVATGLPLSIRLNHEMNGIWYPWSETDSAGNPINGNRVGDYAKVWRYVHDIFEKEGANKYVIWVWSPNVVNKLPASHQGAAYLAGLYPGDDYVDWVGMSGYLRPPYKTDDNFTFDYTFGPTLNELRKLTNKPIYLAEVGASEIGGHKPGWVSNFFTALKKPENSDIKGFSWFNLAVTTYVQGERATNDWRIDSRADSLGAFIAGIADK